MLDFKNLFKNYIILKKLGQGGFSNVTLIRCLRTGNMYALKSIKKKQLETDHKKLL